MNQGCPNASTADFWAPTIYTASCFQNKDYNKIKLYKWRGNSFHPEGKTASKHDTETCEV
jgi:hypothetical protein